MQAGSTPASSATIAVTRSRKSAAASCRAERLIETQRHLAGARGLPPPDLAACLAPAPRARSARSPRSPPPARGTRRAAAMPRVGWRQRISASAPVSSAVRQRRRSAGSAGRTRRARRRGAGPSRAARRATTSLAHGRVEQLVAPAARRLRPVERRVRVAQHVLRPVVPGHAQRDADARASRRPRARRSRRPPRAPRPSRVGHPRHVGRVLDAAEDDRELVPAEPRHRVPDHLRRRPRRPPRAASPSPLPAGSRSRRRAVSTSSCVAGRGGPGCRSPS